MFKLYIPIAFLVLTSVTTKAAERAEPAAPSVATATHGVSVCSPGERWEHGQDLVNAVPAVTLQEFTATAKDRSAPLRGFSEGLLLKADKSDAARALGEYWMGRALYLANLHGPAISQFNLLIAQNPNSRTIPFQLAAMECVRNIHANFPVPLLTNDAMANLPDYFKAGVVPEKNRRPLLDMAVELVARRIAEKASAESVESALKLLAGGGYYEDYARAIWAANRKKLEGVTVSLRRLAEAKDLPPTLEARRNEIKLLLARAHYQDKKFKEASKYLDTVDKRSNAFVQALVLQSWTDLARNEHRRVVGTTLAIQSTGLRQTFAPEPYMTGAMALNEFCLFPEALRILSNFKRTYAPSYEWLRQNSKSTKRDLYPEAIAHLTKQPTNVPPQLASEWIRSPIFLSNQRAINGSFQQEKAINGIVKSAEAFAVAEAARLEALRRKVTIREATEIAKESQRKSSAADFNARHLHGKSVASGKAVDDATRDAARLATAAEAEAKRAAEAPVTSQKVSQEASAAANQFAAAKVALAAAETAEAAAKASVIPAKMALNLADDKASAAERMAHILDLGAKEAERQKALAFLPLRRGEEKAKKTAADAKVVAAKAEQAKLALELVERDYAYAKAESAKAREEAAVAAQALREALKKGNAGVGASDGTWERAWDKARAEKAAAEERARRALLAQEVSEKRLVGSEAAVSRTSLIAQGSAREAAQAHARATKASGSRDFDAFEKALRVIGEAKAADVRARADATVAAQAAANHASLKADVDAAKRKLAEAESSTRDAVATLETLRTNATDARSARKMAATAEAAAKKAATVAQAATVKATAARQLFAKLDREAATSASLATSAQATFLKASESVRPFEKRAVEIRTEANLAQGEGRRLRALADVAKERVLKMQPLVQSRTKVVAARSEESGKLGQRARQAAERAEAAKANIAVAAQTAKNAAQKAADGKAKVQAAELVLVTAKKDAAEAKEKATAIAQVAKECAKFAADVLKTGGKPGAVPRPQVAVLEQPSPEMARLTELLKVTEARQAQLQKSLAVWIQTLKQYKEGAPRHRERLMARMETAFKSLNDRMLRQLEAVAKNNDLVEAEIWHGAGKDLVWQNANPEYAAAIKDGKFQTRSPASDGAYDWGTTTLSRNGKREVWEDEVGNATAALVDNCSNKEKYATLRKGK